MKLLPYKNRLIGELAPIPDKSKGGIIFPAEARAQPSFARIEGFGNKVEDLNEGDLILFYEGAGRKISVNGKNMIILFDSDVLATVVGITLESVENL